METLKRLFRKKEKEQNFYILRIYKRDIDRMYELLGSRGDIYSKVLLDGIKSQVEHQKGGEQ